jgi:hypothetical protein
MNMPFEMDLMIHTLDVPTILNRQSQDIRELALS